MVLKSRLLHQSTRLPGVSKEDILREAETSPLETDVLIKACLRDGIIYEPVKGFYRLTRDLA